jgi:hypothetical protein
MDEIMSTGQPRSFNVAQKILMAKIEDQPNRQNGGNGGRGGHDKAGIQF